MISGNVKFDGRSGMAHALRQLKAKCADMSPAMAQLGELFVTDIKENFRVGGRFADAESFIGGSKKWPESLRASLEGGQTLIDKGGLKNSLSHRALKDGVEITAGKEYSAIHQFGGDIVPVSAPFLRFTLANGAFVQTKKVTLPERPFMNVQPDTVQDGLELLKTFFDLD